MDIEHVIVFLSVVILDLAHGMKKLFAEFVNNLLIRVDNSKNWIECVS